jgi:cytochrome c-type biogenesis protein CcmE
VKLFIVGVVFLSAMGVLVWIGIVEGSIPVLTVAQALSQPAGKVCRIDKAKIHSIESLSNPLLFTIAADENSSQTIRVESRESAPDNFSVGKNVGVKGVYDSKAGRFMASEVTTQCPSKYEASKDVKLPASGPASLPLSQKAS